MKAGSVKGDFGENRGVSALNWVQKVMYWELGLEKWSRTGSILMIYDLFFREQFYSELPLQLHPILSNCLL